MRNQAVPVAAAAAKRGDLNHFISPAPRVLLNSIGRT